MTASSLADVAGFADELLVLERGKVVARGSLEEALTIPDMIEMPAGELVAS